jgi:predicted small metal-binding protein
MVFRGRVVWRCAIRTPGQTLGAIQRTGEGFTGNLNQEVTMSRKYIDCREFPGDIKCSIAISADSDKELMEAAVQHAVAVHGFKDTRQLRKDIKSGFHKGNPPLKAPKPA